MHILADHCLAGERVLTHVQRQVELLLVFRDVRRDLVPSSYIVVGTTLSSHSLLICWISVPPFLDARKFDLRPVQMIFGFPIIVISLTRNNLYVDNHNRSTFSREDL